MDSFISSRYHKTESIILETESILSNKTESFKISLTSHLSFLFPTKYFSEKIMSSYNVEKGIDN